MMIRQITTIFLIFTFQIAFSQEQELNNRVDENGIKQGKWIKKFENGNILYDGYFIDGKPVGEFKRYYQNGDLISILIHSRTTDSVDATFYHPGGFIAARGIYIKQMRTGIWKFYSARFEDCLICRENYINNSKEGPSIKYHWNGNIAEEINYKNNIKDGAWKQYFTDGTICLLSSYVIGKVNGSFQSFHPDGKKEIVGLYKNDVRDGRWKFYNANGTEGKTIVYHNGIPENRTELIRKETEYLDMLEKKGGKIEDPEKSGVVKW